MIRHKPSNSGKRPAVGCVGRLLTLLVVLTGIVISVNGYAAKHSVLYSGGPLYNNAATHRDMIRASGFTTVVLWTIHVYGDGDLVLNDKKIIDDGVYVGRAAWPEEVAAFKKGETSVDRVEISIGSWGVADFETIESLVASQGTGPTSILYKNFLALRNSIPSIDAISYDDESNYDVNSTVVLSTMLSDMGFKISLCPYTRSTFWRSVYSNVNSQRPGTIDRVYLQCYAGGASNNPGTWNGYFSGLSVTPGLWCYPNGTSGKRTPAEIQTQMSTWYSSYHIAGGFIWFLDDMLSNQSTYPVASYASAVNNALSIDPYRTVVASLYQDCDYGGWVADFGIGAYTAADIIAAGGRDNDASSVKVEPGCYVTFFADDNFQGATLVKTADDVCFVDDGWNDRMSSMIIDGNPDPIAHWSFDEAGGFTAYDISVNNHNGTLVNMTADSWVSGKQCTAISLDGIDDYVQISGFKGVLRRAARSCTAWIKTTQKSGEIVTWGELETGGKWIIRVNETDSLRTEVQGGYIYGTTSINDGNWHHIVVVMEDDGSPDVSEIRLYVDGKQDTIAGVLPRAINTPAVEDVRIGVFSDMTRFFQGLIDDVRIYNRALESSEIKTLYKEQALRGDIEPDGDIDLYDFAVLAGFWQNPDGCSGDLTCDCTVDINDFLVLSEQWLSQLPAE